jgi:hypothetical protein
MNAKTHPLRFRMRTALGTIAILAVTFALLDFWLFAPYRAEDHAASALMRLGGKVVLVDNAPTWLRGYLGGDLLPANVAAIIDLSHSSVTDRDLVHLLAFQHFGVLDLSDTDVSDAGLVHLSKVAGGRFIDLSRTRVTDVSVLFSDKVQKHPSGLKLSGNRIVRLFPFKREWCPLQDLDLSHTNVDDAMVESLPEGLVNLMSLDLSGTEVSDECLMSLLRLEGLTTLNLTDSRVTAEGVARLKSSWRGRGTLTVLSGTTKKPGSALKNPAPAGQPGRSVPKNPAPAGESGTSVP